MRWRLNKSPICFVSSIDFVKSYVEGGELFAMRGGGCLLHKHMPILFCELPRKWSAKFGYYPNEVFEFFKKIVYEAYVATYGGSLLPSGRIDDQTVPKNFIFLIPTFATYFCRWM